MHRISYLAVCGLAFSVACAHDAASSESSMSAEQRRAASHQRADDLMHRYEALVQAKGLDRASTPIGACDAAALYSEGLDEALRQKHAEALQLYEASLACKFQPEVARSAFLAACQAKDTDRAQKYFATLATEPKRDLMREACVSFGVTALR
jgi:hypothetical protein